jgi:hypothetical protein
MLKPVAPHRAAGVGRAVADQQAVVSKSAEPAGVPMSTGGDVAAIGGNGGTIELPPTLTTCDLGGAPSFDDGLVRIDDFDDDDALFSGNGLDGGWYAYGDGSSGTITGGDGLAPVPLGVEGGALRVEAGGFTSWGPVFGAWLSESCLFDASAYDGVTFYAKGNVTGAPNGKVSLRLVGLEDITPDKGGLCESNCYNSPYVELSLDSDCYSRYSFRFDEFHRVGESESTLAPSELYLMDFAIGTATSFEIWIDELSFFAGMAPAAEEVCD